MKNWKISKIYDHDCSIECITRYEYIATILFTSVSAYTYEKYEPLVQAELAIENLEQKTSSKFATFMQDKELVRKVNNVLAYFYE